MNNAVLLEQIKRELESSKEEIAEAKATFKLLMQRLEKEFGCKTVKEAKELLDQLKQEHEKEKKKKQEEEQAIIDEAKDKGII